MLPAIKDNGILRDYQIKLKQGVFDAWRGGARDVCAVSPTGSGKTKTSASIVKEFTAEGLPTVISAHRQELVAQLSCAMAAEGVYHNIIASRSTVNLVSNLHVAKFGRAYYHPDAPSAVSSVDTIIRRDLGSYRDSVALYMTDEAHHLAGAAKGGPNKWLKARQMFPSALGLGVTATPDRSDGQGLGRHADGCFDVLVEGPTMRELIRRGYLTDYRIFCPPSDMDLSQVSVSAGGDYSRDGLKLASRKSSIVGDVVKEYLKIAAGKRGITFAVSVEDAEDIAQRFNDCGVPAVALSANNTDKEREDAIEALRRGDILQIVNVDLLGEGVDIPAIEVVSFARPTQSYSLYIQMFGRALRPAEGKAHAIIIDHVGNVERFIAKGRGLPDSPQTWTLDRRERHGRKDTDDIVINLTVCDECFAAYDKSLDCCPHCGAVPAPGAGVGRSAPEQVEGDLYEMPAELLAKLRGEADRLVTESPEQTRDKMLAAGAPSVAAYGAAKNIRQRAESQHALRGVMAQWCNMWERLGIDRSSVQSMFYQAYGCDVLTAQTLGRSEADTLAGRIAADLKNYCA